MCTYSPHFPLPSAHKYFSITSPSLEVDDSKGTISLSGVHWDLSVVVEQRHFRSWEILVI